MKSIVLGLALANVGYFLWAHGIGQSQAVPTAAPTMTLQLASEAPATAAADAGVSAGSVASSGPPANGERCVTVGPFRDVSEASRAASTLRGGGYDPRQRVADGNIYWIDIDLKPTDGPLNPADLQGEVGRIQRLELEACPVAEGT